MTGQQVAVRATFLLWVSALAVAVIFGTGTSTAAPTAPADVVCVAHRGGNQWSPAHTEQTGATWEAALAAGVPVIEGDVRFTSTGYPYLLHDANLTLFGHPTVPLSTISGTVASGATYVSTTGDKILSLYSAREKLLAAPDVRAEFELKTTLDADDWTMLASRLDPIRSRVTITSFSKATVQAAQEHGYRTGLLASTFEPTAEAPTYGINFAALEPDDVAIHAAVGVATSTWTIDTQTQWEDAAAAGVTHIITNDPAACMTWTETP
jgi:glycerophosphoryl diester phosphodiesterase